jgi:hypothetical protein
MKARPLLARLRPKRTHVSPFPDPPPRHCRWSRIRSLPPTFFFRLLDAQAGHDGLLQTIAGGICEGRESSVEGGDTNDEACDGDSDDSDGLCWPSELLYKPRHDRPRPLPTPSAQQNTGPSHGGLGDGETGIVIAREGEHRDGGWESCGEEDNEPEGRRTHTKGVVEERARPMAFCTMQWAGPGWTHPG